MWSIGTSAEKRRRLLAVFLILSVAGLCAAVMMLRRDVRDPRKLPLEGRLSLVESLAKEPVLETLRKLPDFDDTAWVAGTMNAGTWHAQDGYEYNRVFIPRLNRVRKILAEIDDANRGAAIAVLENLLTSSCQGYDQVHKAKIALLAAAKKGVTLNEPDEYNKRIVNAPAAAYLLSELDSFNSLKAMSAVYDLPHRLPTSRVFVFYAMHTLAQRHPRDQLSAAAKDSLDEYLKAAAPLPDAQEGLVPAWNAQFEESDFRHLVFGQDLGFAKGPTVRLRFYPPLPDCEDFRGETVSAEIAAYHKKLRAFIQRAYP
ncbi:MAG: hypothetical protein L0Y71_16995 [Gemmataceae bacterium]|nr:hypothetical protein [Gemmataceae bacterium]